MMNDSYEMVKLFIWIDWAIKAVICLYFVVRVGGFLLPKIPKARRIWRVILSIWDLLRRLALSIAGFYLLEEMTTDGGQFDGLLLLFCGAIVLAVVFVWLFIFSPIFFILFSLEGLWRKDFSSFSEAFNIFTSRKKKIELCERIIETGRNTWLPN